MTRTVCLTFCLFALFTLSQCLPSSESKRREKRRVRNYCCPPTRPYCPCPAPATYPPTLPPVTVAPVTVAPVGNQGSSGSAWYQHGYHNGLNQATNQYLQNQLKGYNDWINGYRNWYQQYVNFYNKYTAVQSGAAAQANTPPTADFVNQPYEHYNSPYARR